MQSFTNEVNFSLIGFDRWDISYEPYSGSLSITDFTDDFSKMNINDFDKTFILDKMIKYSDVNNDLNKYLLSTSLSKSDFINKYLSKLDIEKNNNSKTASVVMEVLDDYGVLKRLILPTINDFDSSASFLLNKTINHKLDDSVKIDDIDDQYVINNLIAYDQQELISNKTIISTNISKEEFVNNYLDKIAITSSEEDKFNNNLKISLLLNTPINNQIKYDFNIRVLTSRAYLKKNAGKFELPKYLIDKNISDINEEDIYSLIKTKDNNIIDYLFEINVNFNELKKYLTISLNKNEFLGIINVQMGLQNIGNSINDMIQFTLVGFDNNIEFKTNNNEIDISWFSVFDNISDFNQIDDNFIINNLIKFIDSPSQNNIIGSFNVSKDDFLQLYKSIDIVKEGNSLNITINLKNSITTNARGLRSNTVSFKITDIKKENVEVYNPLPIILGTTIPAIIILLAIVSFFIYKKIKLRKFRDEVDNEI